MSGHTDARARHLAIALVALACVVLAGMDALGKHLMRHLPAAQVVWARYTFHTLLVIALLGPRHHRQFLHPRHPGLQFLRGLCLLGVTFGMYTAIHLAPLGEVTAILFLAPVLVTLLAAWLLREALRPIHLLALLLGFSGVLVILRPGATGFQPVMLLPLGSAVLLALYFILTRRLRGHDSEYTTLLHTTLAGTLILSLAAPAFWTPPSGGDWPLLAAMGLLGAAGHLMLIQAFHRAPAADLSPWLNLQIAAAALYGSWLFGDILRPGFALGAGLIVAGGLLGWHAQRRRDRL